VFLFNRKWIDAASTIFLMIDHVILTVSDFKRSVAFYAKALKPLGITNFIDYEGKDRHPDLKGFGDGKTHFFGSKKGSPILRPFTSDSSRKTIPK
jgi:catechol 2,3-dioxygenase-like lactoylglutathione lyase family enzyme